MRKYILLILAYKKQPKRIFLFGCFSGLYCSINRHTDYVRHNETHIGKSYACWTISTRMHSLTDCKNAFSVFYYTSVLSICSFRILPSRSKSCSLSALFSAIASRYLSLIHIYKSCFGGILSSQSARPVFGT